MQGVSCIIVLSPRVVLDTVNGFLILSNRRVVMNVDPTQLALYFIVYLLDPFCPEMDFDNAPDVYRRSINVLKEADKSDWRWNPVITVRIHGEKEVIVNLDTARSGFVTFVQEMWGKDTLYDAEAAHETLCALLDRTYLDKNAYPLLVLMKRAY